ncbi:flagellin N-methylase family protein [Helicobacter fennelliae]|uniref:Flagellin N-methylase family protein n=1 Tax=Helicobacter fennelliae TaxID=215 RepID=A0A2X3DJI4_9HELI|nr:YkgJ family cysteine cluster protein [Helicobacter fennelliae]SQB98450.1 flagellin N-methylase family protein [Helicobacter fennelliae]
MQDFSFRFSSEACKTCGGKCCTGESGYIFLTLQEAQNISAFLQIPFEDFALRYLKKVGYRFSLIEKPYNGQWACVFFDEQKKNCLVYEYRPKQCRTFPFWESYKQKANLKELLEICPGVKCIS